MRKARMMSLVYIYIYIKKNTYNYFYNNYDSFITTLFNNKPTHDSAHLLGSTYSNWY